MELEEKPRGEAIGYSGGVMWKNPNSIRVFVDFMKELFICILMKETPKPAAQATAAAANVPAAVAGGVSEAKMDELIQAIDRLTEAVKALSGEKKP